MLRILPALALIVAMATPLSASTFVAATTPELVRDSDAVIEGHVRRLESFWNEDGRVIVTEALIEVDESLVGQAPSLIAVRVPGGTVGDFTVIAEGFSQLRLNERVILFVKSQPGASYSRIVGHQQGHFEVVERNDGVRLAVPRVEDGARFFTRSGRLAPEARSLELEVFKNGIRELGRRAGRIVE